MSDNKNTTSAWTTEKEFKDEESNLIVKLQKKSGFRPVYSYQISRMRDDGKIVPFIPVFIRTGNGKVTGVEDNFQVLEALVKCARDYAVEQASAREEEILNERIAKEEAALARDKPKQKPGLKTLSKQEAQKKTAQGVG